jgi:hypothetical protein
MRVAWGAFELLRLARETPSKKVQALLLAHKRVKARVEMGKKLFGRERVARFRRSRGGRFLEQRKTGRPGRNVTEVDISPRLAI